MPKRALLITLFGLLVIAAGYRLVSRQATGPRAQSTGSGRPMRIVNDTGDVLRSMRDPRVMVEFTQPINYLGTDRWVLYDVADCEIHVFVEGDAQKRVKRLYWVQFEGYLPTVPHSYSYDSPTRVTLGPLEFFVDPWQSRSDAPYRRPGSDREHVFTLIRARGFKLPEELNSVRLVHLPDAEKRKELMIIYSEDLAPTGYTIAELEDGGKAAAQRPVIEKALRDRAIAGMKITRMGPRAYN
jgi:hypothetical protein